MGLTDLSTGLTILVSIGLLGLGAGAGAAMVWYFLTRRKNGRHER
jgi:uncharacterized protein involved in exopolysaccharide biosynthesis